MGGSVTPLPLSAADRPATSSFAWYDARLLTVEGKGYNDTEQFWQRLPARAKGKVPPAVWDLSKHTAGICVRFVTDSTTIAAEWDGVTALKMNHMAFSGSAGLDLYRRTGRGWRYVATGRPQDHRTSQVLISKAPAGFSEYLLHLPPYHPTTSLRIGIDPAAKLAPAAPRSPERAKPIVFYGTSITQGGCASRAGMGHVMILGRWLDRPVINLGFSGSGKGEPEVLDLVNELDAAVFVLEPLPNMTTEQVRERLPMWVEKLRTNHPQTPILLVENPLKSRRDEQNRALQKVFADARKKGIARLYLLPADKQLAGREEGTVDGVHPTDLGFVRMAECYAPVLRRLLSLSGE